MWILCVWINVIRARKIISVRMCNMVEENNLLTETVYPEWAIRISRSYSANYSYFYDHFTVSFFSFSFFFLLFSPFTNRKHTDSLSKTKDSASSLVNKAVPKCKNSSKKQKKKKNNHFYGEKRAKYKHALFECKNRPWPVDIAIRIAYNHKFGENEKEWDRIELIYIIV